MKGRFFAKRNKWIFFVLLALFILPMLTTALGQESELTGPTDSREMEAFFDGVMLSNLDMKHIAGVSLVVVKDGVIFFSKGYGKADVGNGVAVDPANTLFRIGSVTKLFTWTAVMQLVEQGKLDLDADVNSYIDFEIPATYAEPVTLKHLLCHTAGFEDRVFGVNAATPDDMVSNGEWLATHIPARVRPAGELAAYSNYGTSLAGHIVERVSGLSYQNYIKQNILQPLGMTKTSSQQPLPAALAKDLSQGYKFVDGRHMPQAFELYVIEPAGGMSATATDMARFMIAHLQDGRFGDARILEETTAQQMHSRLFSHDDRINGMAHGFLEMDRGEQRIIGHGGDTILFHSQLALLPDQDIGFFASCNSAECMSFPQIMFDAFMNHYYPKTDFVMTPSPEFDAHAPLVAGRYLRTRTSYTSAEKILQLVTTDSFRALEDGSLLKEEQNVRFIETEPFVFRDVKGDNIIIFEHNNQGKVTQAYIGGSPAAFEPRTWFNNPRLHFALLGVSVLFFLTVLLGGPIFLLARRGLKQAPQPLLAKLARWDLIGAVLLCLVFMLLFALATPGNAAATGKIPFINLWPIVFGLIIVLACAALIFTFLAWRNRYWTVFERVHYSMVGTSIWLFIGLVNYWHLLRW